MALPILDVMEPEAQGAARLSNAAMPPRRLACVFQPNGVFPPAWNVEGSERDWTLGCIKLSNADIEKLFAQVPEGTAVWIK